MSAQFVKLPANRVYGAIEQALQRVRTFFACETRLRLATEAAGAGAGAGAGLWSVDLSDGQVWVTDRMRDLFQLADHGTLSLRSLLERIHPEERHLVHEAMRQSLVSGQEFQIDFRIVGSDGDLRWIDLRGCPEPGSAKERGRLTGIALDITELKGKDAEAQLHLEELAHLSRLSTVGELTTSLAHELNQPLGAILRNAEAAELHLRTDQPDLQELRDIVADIRKDDERAGQVINRLNNDLSELAEKLGLFENAKAQARLAGDGDNKVAMTHGG